MLNQSINETDISVKENADTLSEYKDYLWSNKDIDAQEVRSTKPDAKFIDRISYKASFEFISLLDKFILHVENTYFKAIDVKLTKYITLPSEYIEEQYRRFHRYPMRQRFEAMMARSRKSLKQRILKQR